MTRVNMISRVITGTVLSLGMGLPLMAATLTASKQATKNIDTGYSMRAPQSITQSVDTSTITTGISIVCTEEGAGTTENKIFRRFDLDGDHALSNFQNVTSVDFGIESATGAGGDQPVTVVLHSIFNGAPMLLANLTQIGIANFDFADTASEVVNFPVSGFINPLLDDLVVEIHVPDGQAEGNYFLPGMNKGGETGPSMLWAPACELDEITELENASPSFTQAYLMVVNVEDPEFTIDDVSHLEGTSIGAGSTDFVFTVSRSHNGADMTVDFVTADGSATVSDSDYVTSSGTLKFFADGAMNKTITVQVTHDFKIEPDETFLVNLSNPVGAGIADIQGVGTILNDDAVPDISIDDVSQREGTNANGSTEFVFTVSRSHSGTDMSVGFATADDSATIADADYMAHSGTLDFFADGAASQTITVQVTPDARLEPDEIFFVELNNPVEANILDAQGEGGILNDDFDPQSCNIPANPIENCSFETGDFTSWVTKDMVTPSWALHVGIAGEQDETGIFTAAPTDGTYAALHGFDGEGPDTIEIGQDVTIPSGATSLEFDYQAAWDLLNAGPALVDRTFIVVIEPAGGGEALQTSPILTAEVGTVDDTGPLHGSVDISAFAGEDPVRVNFVWDVPEAFTGPAGFQLDNVFILAPVVTVTPTSGLETTEDGGTDSFDVVLQSPPGGTVTIELVSDNLDEGTVSPSTLTFEADDWFLSQTVTVEGVDDNYWDGDLIYNILSQLTVGTSLYPSDFPVDSVEVTNLDNNWGCMGPNLIVVADNIPPGSMQTCTGLDSLTLDPGIIVDGPDGMRADVIFESGGLIRVIGPASFMEESTVTFKAIPPDP